MEKLKKESTKTEKELLQAKHQENRLHNRIDYLDTGDRKKRTHRLITRGAAIESILPEVKDMDEVSFYTLMEEVLLHPDVADHIRRSVESQKSGDS